MSRPDRSDPPHRNRNRPNHEGTSGQTSPRARTDEPCVLAVDPGRAKCGLAVVSLRGVLEKEAVATARLAEEARTLASRHGVTHVVVGDRTTSAAAFDILSSALPGAVISRIDETGSSLEGRKRYFAENSPRGWRKLVPRGLLTPPEPYDDYVAVILAERFLQSLEPRGG